MQLGNFALCLAVNDLTASRAFYEKLGFAQVSGDPAQNWLVLRNSTTKIGLFQWMFPKNMLTFNPGWTSDAKALDEFQDVRDIQAALMEQGIQPEPAADPKSTGPASFMIVDPDGNPILFDQHVPRP
jgi:catechol 2,3-dioxygenase-like lactoylglutathione lyase family enzyme